MQVPVGYGIVTVMWRTCCENVGVGVPNTAQVCATYHRGAVFHWPANRDTGTAKPTRVCRARVQPKQIWYNQLMSRACTVCTHPRRREIDRALLSGISRRKVAAQFDLGTSSVDRHYREHVLEDVATAGGILSAEPVAGQVLLAQAMVIHERAVGIMDTLEERARSEGGNTDWKNTISALREVRSSLTELAKLNWAVADRGSQQDEERPEIDAAIMRVLAERDITVTPEQEYAPFPDPIPLPEGRPE